MAISTALPLEAARYASRCRL